MSRISRNVISGSMKREGAKATGTRAGLDNTRELKIGARNGLSLGLYRKVIFHPAISSPNWRVTSSTISFASSAVSGLHSFGSSLIPRPVRRASSKSRAAPANLSGSMFLPHSKISNFVASFPVISRRRQAGSADGTLQGSAPNHAPRHAYDRGHDRAARNRALRL